MIRLRVSARVRPVARDRGFLAPLLEAAAPLDLRILGRTLLHAALVGPRRGHHRRAFFAASRWCSASCSRTSPATCRCARTARRVVRRMRAAHRFGRGCCLLDAGARRARLAACSRALAPETRGGGGDAMIDAFHHSGGVMRARVIWVKALASMLTLGTGGAGGREGPTMQIGGALGSLVGALPRVAARERRILLVAGVAAGMSAVFRTPLGAALLAVEVLYRDDFESDALIPARPRERRLVLGRHLDLRRDRRCSRTRRAIRSCPAHLPLYALLALLVALARRAVRRASLRRRAALVAALPVPAWAAARRSAASRSGVVASPADPRSSAAHRRRRGRGSASSAAATARRRWRSPARRGCRAGWRGGASCCSCSCVAKLVAASLTIGIGRQRRRLRARRSCIGGLFGGAFGRAAQLLLDDPRIDPGAFALVGMGTFYGGIAHVPLSALVHGVRAGRQLRSARAADARRGHRVRRAAQATRCTRRRCPTQRDSPAHTARCRRARSILTVERDDDAGTPLRRASSRRRRAAEMLRADRRHELAGRVPGARARREDGRHDHLGVAARARLRAGAAQPWTVAADLMQAAGHPRAPTTTCARRRSHAVEQALREIPVVDRRRQDPRPARRGRHGQAYLGATQERAVPSQDPRVDPLQYRLRIFHGTVVTYIVVSRAQRRVGRRRRRWSGGGGGRARRLRPVVPTGTCFAQSG